MLASAGTDSRHCEINKKSEKDYFFEDVASSLDFGVVIAEDKSIEVLEPNLATVRIREGVETFLVDAEGFLVAVVLFEVGCVVENVLRERTVTRKVLEA